MKLITFLLSLLLIPAAYATTWYASPSGSGTACTTGSPCTTSQAETNASAGDTILFKDGTYGAVTFTKSGTSGAHLILSAENKWGAKFTATGSAGNSVFRSNGNYVEIHDIEISGSTNDVDGILLGAASGAMTYGLVDGVKVHGVANPGCSGGGGVHIWNNLNSSNVTVSDSVIYDIGSHGTCTQQHGIYVTGSGHTIVNNLIFNITGYGIHLWHTATSIIVANNTVAHCGTDGASADGIVIGAASGEGTVDNTAVLNNISIDNGRYGIGTQGSVGSNNKYSNNITYNNVTANTQSPIVDTNGIHTDPLFVTYAPTGTTSDFHLQSTSPAREGGVASLVAGTTTGNAPAADIESTTRPQESIDDIGAYEYTVAGGGGGGGSCGAVTPTLVQQATGTSTSGTSTVANLPAAPTAGSALIAFVEGAQHTTSVAGGGVTWTKITGPCAHSCTEAFYGLNSSGSGTAITATLTLASTAQTIWVGEYSNILTSAAFDQGPANTSASTATFSTGSITPTTSGQLVVGLAAVQTGGGSLSSGPTNSFTARSSVTAGAARTSLVADIVQATAAAISTGWTWSLATGSDTMMLSFKPVTGTSCIPHRKKHKRM